MHKEENGEPRKRFEKIRNYFESEKVKAHFRKNRNAYFAGIAGIAAGAGGTALLVRRTDVLISPKIQQILSYRPEAHMRVVVELTERANLSKPVRIKGSTRPEDIFISQSDYARKHGVSPGIVSGHLNGKIPDVNGIQLEWLPKVSSSSQN
jgi:hypothetical protein